MTEPDDSVSNPFFPEVCSPSVMLAGQPVFSGQATQMFDGYVIAKLIAVRSSSFALPITRNNRR